MSQSQNTDSPFATKKLSTGAGGQKEDSDAASPCDISRFSPRINRIFPLEALDLFSGAQDEGFWDFVLYN